MNSKEKITVYSDNQSALQLVKNHAFHERTKHIDVKLYFIRDVVSSGRIEVEKIDTDDNPADAFTKVLSVAKFDGFMRLVQVVRLDPGGKKIAP